MSMGKKGSLVFAVIVSALVLFFTARNCMSVDTCLDRGGSWDHKEKRCVFNKNDRQ